MTTFWRTFILVVAGLGAAWAVTQVGSGPPTVLNTLEEPAPAAAATPAAALEAPRPPLLRQDEGPRPRSRPHGHTPSEAVCLVPAG